MQDFNTHISSAIAHGLLSLDSMGILAEMIYKCVHLTLTPRVNIIALALVVTVRRVRSVN